MAIVDPMSSLHKSTKRDYLARVNDIEYPKHRAASLAKKFDYDYWDGDRRICYGGYKYIPGRWTNLAEAFVKHYKLDNNSNILDIGCGKGFLMHELKLLLPKANIQGLDISKYAIENSKPEVKEYIQHGNANKLQYPTDSFDFVYSINTLHCLEIQDLTQALSEVERVSRKSKYICVESYRNEIEKANLLYWQVTCESFFSTNAWQWILNTAGYSGDHSFIFFE